MIEIQEKHQKSVYGLITSLCRIIYNENVKSDKNGSAAVSHLRLLAYEILLKKSKNNNKWDLNETNFDPLYSLNLLLFTTKLTAKHRGEDATDFEEKLTINLTPNCEQYFFTDTGKKVLQFIFALEDLPKQRKLPKIMKELHVPGAFTLFANYSNNVYYPKRFLLRFKNSKPKYFQTLTKMKNKALNTYVNSSAHNYILETHNETLYLSSSKRNRTVYTSANTDCTFTGMTRRLMCDADWLCVDLRNYIDREEPPNFYALQMSIIPRNQLTSSVKSKIDELPYKVAKRVKIRKSESLIEPREYFSCSWEWHLEKSNSIQYAKPFFGDVNLTFNLQAVAFHDFRQNIEVKLLTNKHFIENLKLLTVGIKSDIFQYNKQMIFSMIPNLTVPNVLPTIISNYVKEFLDCGTYFKRLQIMTIKKDYKLIYDGFIYKSLCEAISEYLLTFRQFVFSIKSEETLVGFYRRMKKPMRQILNLAKTLVTIPEAEYKNKLPMGSQFLGYIYRQIIRITDNDYITLLMFLLKRCCHVYFKYLQLWIFNGILDDPSNELFICYLDHYRKKTKYFYEKAYFIRKEAVPGFFQNFEDRILQCGKYTMLLKAYNPNHPLLELNCPQMRVCLSFDEIETLKHSCQNYAEKALKNCGKPVTVSDIFKARKKRQNEFKEMALQRSCEAVERWAIYQEMKSNANVEKKRKQQAELIAHMEIARQNRINKRRQNVELDLKAIRETQAHAEIQISRQNINLRNQMKYYKELGEILQEKPDGCRPESSLNKTRRYSFENSEEFFEQTPSTTYTYSTNSLKTFCGELEETDNVSKCTENFQLEFSKSVRKLQALSNKEYANNNFLHKKKLPKSVLNSNVEIDSRFLQRSISDVINSNLPSEESADTGIAMAETLNPLQLNRLKTLTGTIGLCLIESPNLENRTNSRHIMTLPLRSIESINLEKGGIHWKSLPDVNFNTVPSDELFGDLKKNRERVMHSHLQFLQSNNQSYKKDVEKNSTQTDLEKKRQQLHEKDYVLKTKLKVHRKSLPDINTAACPFEILSDLQRNRKRMMESPNIFSEISKPTKPALSFHPQLNIALNTERSRNRRKVLESEYNIVTGDLVSAQDVLTPMSTTSDPTFAEQLIEQDQKSDIANGNLQLNVSISTRTTEQEAGSMSDLSLYVTPSTGGTQQTVTPLEAFTSAEKRVHDVDGFNFTTRNFNPLSEGIRNLDMNKDFDKLNESVLDLKYKTPYERCAKLVASKFQSPMRNSVFQLFSDINSSTSNGLEVKNFQIDSLSVITLTEFLKKSVILPMNTHLELVNSEIMRILLVDLRLIDHFRSLRQYYFMMNGEFGSIICNKIIGLVESNTEPSKVLSYQMLHLILDNALSGSIQKDNNADNLSFIVTEVPLKFDLNSPNVLNVFSLSYRIQWPLNLILSPETLDQYGNIFKYLLKVRRVSYVLERAFELLRQASKKHGKCLLRSTEYLRIQQIRHKFYHFVHTLQHHITSTALQASWKIFKDELILAKSLEDIYRMHAQYVKRILFLCMLNRSSAEFNNTIENIFRIALNFYNNLKFRDFRQRTGSKEFTHMRFSKMVAEEEEFEKLIKYTIYLGNKIVQQGYQAEIGEFITLLNINQYYTK